LNFLDRFSKKFSNIKFHENPPSGSLVIPCGRTDGGTDIRKLIIAFCNFEKALIKVAVVLVATFYPSGPVSEPCQVM